MNSFFLRLKPLKIKELSLPATFYNPILYIKIFGGRNSNESTSMQ